jgi:hypothetical protein
VSSTNDDILFGITLANHQQANRLYLELINSVGTPSDQTRKFEELLRSIYGSKVGSLPADAQILIRSNLSDVRPMESLNPTDKNTFNFVAEISISRGAVVTTPREINFR